jgi:3-methyladenine DNA glycosylase AlkD
MPTLAPVMADLKSKASEKTRATYIRHGAPPDLTLGVSVADMKLIVKTIKKQQTLACELYATGIFDAMYLAGMVADGAQLTPAQLQSWAEGAAGMPMIFEYTVPWVALESPSPSALAAKWIASKKEHIAAAGWCTYSGLVATAPDAELDLPAIEALLKSIPAKINSAPNRVRSTMNSFVIAAGTYVAPLLKQATAVAKQLGAVAVDVGDTACEIPVASDRIAKAHASGRTAKRKTMRC